MAHFEIDASVVFQLGESLITDEFQALLELVKNSYDADATECTVTIETGGSPPEGSAFPDADGYVLIDDNGFGMTKSTIESGWLTIAHSAKRDLKDKGETTPRGRTPLGDKGLGRLSVQRLGNNIELWSQPDPEILKDDSGETDDQRRSTQGDFETPHYVRYSWGAFREDVTLSEVPVHLEEVEEQEGSGTRLLISDLVLTEEQIQDWEDRLIEELSHLLSPYESFADFRVFVELNGEPVEFYELSQTVRNAAPVKYEIQFDGDELHLTGRVKVPYLWPQDKDQQPAFNRFIKRNGGAEFLDWLLENKPKAEDFNLERADEREWFCEFSQSRKLSDIGGGRRDGSIANPGEFAGTVYYFLLGSEEQLGGANYGNLSEVRKAVRAFNGIRVYRDRFEIRMGKDWLGLGAAFTRGRSYYALRPGNVLGHISLSASENPDLKEVTDREGFKRTPAYQTFERLLKEFVRFAGQGQGLLRRGWLDYYDHISPKSQEVSEDSSPDSVARSLGTRVTEAREKEREMQANLEEMREALQQPSLEAPTIADGAENTKALSVLESIMDQLEENSARLEQLQQDSKFLARQLDDIEDRMSEHYEMVSLGLTAEALSHELMNILDNVQDKTQKVRRKLKRGTMSEALMEEYVREVRTTEANIRKQVAHLSPALKYVREKKTEIDLAEFLERYCGFWQDRLDRNDIDIEVDLVGDRAHDLVIYTNEGKLVQVLDNMVLNSEHWLKESLESGRIEDATIQITLDPPYLRIEDSGLGIEPVIESSLFEPFRTTKAEREGRGLGLFVVKELLRTMDCSIMLLPERNQHDRLHQFEIDLSGVIRAE